MSSPRPLTVGILGGVLLLAFFFTVLAVAESWAHAWERFGEMWFWIGLLSAGFGIQGGLFWYIRQEVHRRQAQGVASVAASGGVSTGAMVTCCLHHGSDILPIIGLSALAPFLTQYQPFFLALGIMANLFGISLMLLIVKRLGLYQPERGILGRLARLDLRLVRNGTVALSLVVLPLVFWMNSVGVGETSTPSTTTQAALSLAPKTAEANGLAVEVHPVSFSPGLPLRFDIVLNTHQGSLGFDLTQVAKLEDSLGNMYQALSWEGAPAGGHHRSGNLTFPTVAPGARWIELTLYGLYEVPERTFRWALE